ncbi:MAG: hypothetical protein IPK17_09445 [Chloroflexi bacterium]|uniref:hypothetical protein n=1 Tax=Candidatus Flexifilum breve TaxID=3140694 RepID=UPI00313606E3|nr:hypothetical protein [Chloroflexota bacterium]
MCKTAICCRWFRWWAIFRGARGGIWMWGRSAASLPRGEANVIAAAIALALVVGGGTQRREMNVGGEGTVSAARNGHSRARRFPQPPVTRRDHLPPVDRLPGS